MTTERYLGPAAAADAYWMRRALAEAERGVGGTSPNPPVGAVLVRGDLLLAKGFHAQAGGPHAEIEALATLADGQARGATLYVTLEPCSTHGRTPPCVDAILRAGLARVVYGSTDPNPAHAGRAKTLIEAAGLVVSSGALAKECDHLIRVFRHWVTTGQCYFIAKAAMSLDGRLSPGPGKSPWLTSSAARRDAQRLRAQVDAIVIGAGTLRQDDPHLTIRHPHVPPHKPPPWRVVLTRGGALPEQAKLFTDIHAERTIVLRDMDMAELPCLLAAREITSALIEGGGQVLGQAFAAKIVREVCFYYAPRLCGGPLGQAILLDAPSFLDCELLEPRLERLGGDLKLTGFPRHA